MFMRVRLPWLNRVTPESARIQRGRRAERRGRLAEILCLVRLWGTWWRVIAHRLVGKRGAGFGEIDIVAKCGRILAFIEVKARASEYEALESITHQQRARLQSAAATFLAQSSTLAKCDIRFDAMIVSERLWPGRIGDAWQPE